MKLDLDPIEIRNIVIDRAVEALLDGGDYEQRIRERIDKHIDELINANYSTFINERISTMLNESFEHEYTKAQDKLGHKQEVTTISKELQKLITDYWTEKVDNFGRPDKSGWKAVTRAEWTMAQICTDDFNKRLRQEAVNVTGAVKDSLRGTMHEAVDKIMSDLIKVKTPGDKR